jgi:pimeloyl-ACP methyl ester carboxylesterase
MAVVSPDGVRLHVVQAGSGPPVILLHGFPEFSFSWRHQIGPLAAAGFSVLAPDLRGSHLSDKPHGVEAYRIERLVADVAAVVDSTGQPRAHIVGHDWGGLIAWYFAATRPDLTLTLSILNAPHPDIYRHILWRSPQWLKSFYVPFFMMPALIAGLLAAGNYFLLRQMFQRGAARRGAFSEDALTRYVSAAAMPGALSAGLNYYRANATMGWTSTSLPRIAAPTLVIWGEDDPALDLALLSGLDGVVDDLQVVRLPGVGHWVQNEAPERVTALLLSHLQRASHLNA